MEAAHHPAAAAALGRRSLLVAFSLSTCSRRHPCRQLSATTVALILTGTFLFACFMSCAIFCYKKRLLCWAARPADAPAAAAATQAAAPAAGNPAAAGNGAAKPAAPAAAPTDCPKLQVVVLEPNNDLHFAAPLSISPRSGPST